jgi:hypothetical protein
MTFADFQEHMARLVAQFGSQAYSTERLKLFYRELQGTDVRVWERVVDTLLGEARYAPMLPEIREHVSRERERIHAREKLEHKRDSEDTWRALTSEEAQFLFGNMKARIRGEMPNQDFAAFSKLLAKFRSGGEA